MASTDPFGRTDELDDNTLAALVTRFEARGKNPRFANMLGDYLDAMDIDRTTRVLDMGCGTGLAARAIARRRSCPGRLPASISAPISWRRRSVWPARKVSLSTWSFWSAMFEH
jgi:SAM-dependent methyltransferase